MKDISHKCIGSLVLALLVLGLFSVAPAYCQAGGNALLLQQTPAQGGMVSPEIGVHHFASETEVTLIAVPKPGYNFVYWLGDVLDPTASKTKAVLDEPKIIVAVFQQIEDGQIVVGQNATRTIAGGGGGSFTSSMGSTGGSGPVARPRGETPSTPTEGDDPPFDPPIDPPDVPEPATCLLLSLGGLALLRKHRA